MRKEERDKAPKEESKKIAADEVTKRVISVEF